MFGFYADETTYEFYAPEAFDGAARESLVPRFRGLAESSISSGELLVEGGSRGGEAVMEGFSDDNYMLQADGKLNGGETADIWMRYQDSNNGYMLSISHYAKGSVSLLKCVKGQLTQLDSAAWALGVGNNTWVFELNGTSLEVRYEGNLLLSATDIASSINSTRR